MRLINALRTQLWCSSIAIAHSALRNVVYYRGFAKLMYPSPPQLSLFFLHHLARVVGRCDVTFPPWDALGGPPPRPSPT